MKHTLKLGAALSMGLVLSACGGTSKAPEPYSVQFPGPWQGDADVGVAAALVKADAHGCGEFYYRWSTDKRSALVYCSADGKTFQQAFVVFPSSGQFVGPSALPDDVPPPVASEAATLK